jgi:DNA-binding MarR family transcriptional regulator
VSSPQRAARTLARRFDDALRPLGLTSGQYSMMMALNRPEPPSIGSVASLLSMDRTTLTAALKPLQRRDLVTVMVDVADRRGRRLRLTSAGRPCSHAPSRSGGARMPRSTACRGTAWTACGETCRH